MSLVRFSGQRFLLAFALPLLAGCSLAVGLGGLAGPADGGVGPSEAGSTAIDAAVVVAVDAGPDRESGAAIQWRASSQNSGSTIDTINVLAPAGAQPGDLLVAGIGFGNDGAISMTGLTAPAGWTLVRRIDHAIVGSLALFTHSYAGEQSFDWQLSQKCGIAAWISAYVGASRTSPVAADLGIDIAAGGTMFMTPMVSGNSGQLAIVSITAYTASTVQTTWSLPDVAVRENIYNSSQRSGASGDVLVTASGMVGPFAAGASTSQSYALAHVLTLQP